MVLYQNFFISLWNNYNLKKNKMTQEIQNKVREYVLLKYKQTFTPDSTMIIKEYDNFFTVAGHETSSPLILGKGIIE